MSCGAISVYNFSVTGDCSNTNSGEVFFQITGGSVPYTISEYTSTGSLPTSASTTSYYFSGLSAGTYVLQILDFCIPNGVLYLDIAISSGTCVSLQTENTSCGLDNGVITASTENFYGNSNFYLYNINDDLIATNNSVSNTGIFYSLSADTYYVVGDDGGGCTGRSESCIIKSSVTVNYGTYVVNDSSCVPESGSGKIFVTGQTGNPPFTYLWSNGQTGSTITGLTSGGYSVTVTDSSGCSVNSGSIFVDQVLPVGIGSFTVIQPSCFSNDGEATVLITGGTAPFYYSGSNGDVSISFNDTYTFTGLTSGVLNVLVTDAGLCSTIGSVSLITPNGFSITSINTINSSCSNNNGSISIVINAGSPSGSFTYILIDSSGNTISSIVQGSSCTFNNVSSGDYTIVISNGVCTYSGGTTINNTSLFTITATTSGTTCGFNNGTIQILVSSGGTLPYSYQITGYPPSPVSTYNGLSSGFYDVTVTDAGGCSQTEEVYILGSSGVYFDLYVTQPFAGNNGEITTLISSGEPPFTYNWSSNVNGQTGSTVTSLSAGTYTLEVIDYSGCVLTKSVTLNGTNQLNTYQTYSVCNQDFTNSGQLGKRGISQMLNEGFFDLTSGDTNCILNSAIFTANVSVNGVISQDVFYVSSGSTDYPSEQQWADSISGLLYSYSGITEVIIDIEKNQIIIKNGCNEGSTSGNLLSDANVKVNLYIDYDISCESCATEQKVFQDDFEFVFMDDNNYIFQ